MTVLAAARITLNRHKAPHALIAAALIFALTACATPASRFATLTDPSGCLLERIAVESGVTQFSFNGLSPDQRHLAIGWERGEGAAPERGAYLLDLRTGAREDLPAFNNAVSFSPNGLVLIGANYAADRRAEIVAQNRESGAITRYLAGGDSNFLPSFSPDMTSIFLNSYRTGASDIYELDLVGHELKRLTTFEGYDAYARPAPDGRRLAFHRNLGGGNYDLFVLDLETRQERAIAQDPGEDAYPAWSPDGRFILFSSDRAHGGGRNDLYIVSAEGGGVTALTEAGGDDTYANWAANGRDVYFVSHREGHGVYRLRLDRHMQCRRGALS